MSRGEKIGWLVSIHAASRVQAKYHCTPNNVTNYGEIILRAQSKRGAYSRNQESAEGSGLTEEGTFSTSHFWHRTALDILTRIKPYKKRTSYFVLVAFLLHSSWGISYQGFFLFEVRSASSFLRAALKKLAFAFPQTPTAVSKRERRFHYFQNLKLRFGTRYDVQNARRRIFGLENDKQKQRAYPAVFLLASPLLE